MKFVAFAVGDRVFDLGRRSGKERQECEWPKTGGGEENAGFQRVIPEICAGAGRHGGVVRFLWVVMEVLGESLGIFGDGKGATTGV